MAITVRSNASTAINFNQGGSSYLETFNNGFTPSFPNFGRLYGTTSPYSQYGIDNTGAGQAFFVDGNFTYAGGNFDGSISQISFGSGLQYTAAGMANSSTPLDLASDLFQIEFSTPLNDTGASGGSGDTVHEVVYGLMIGDTEALLDVLNSNEINFIGSAADETFQGGALADSLSGNGGNDVLLGGGGKDTIDGGNGADVLSGGDGSDNLRGGAGNDTIDGGSSGDILNGGAGVDQLTGGTGNDRFVFTSASDSTVGAYDTITDFGNTTFGNNDWIDLTGLALVGGLNTTQAGASGGASYQDAAWYQNVGGGTFVYADADSDGTADFAVFLTGYSGSLGAGDILV